MILEIAEEPTEAIEQLGKAVRAFLSNNLNLALGVFEPIHGLGQKRGDFQQPIIMKLLDFHGKMAMFKNTPKLKNLDTKVWTENDYSSKIRIAPVKLWQYGASF